MTTHILDPQAADRLAKLCGMFGSAHDGERATAAAKADELIRSLGLTWHDVISPPIIPDAPRIRSWRSQDDAWRRMALFCHARRWALTGKERDFVELMMAWREPSDRQQTWLIDIYSRLCCAEAVA